MGMTSSCRNCGDGKQPVDYSADYCAKCMAAVAGAEADAQANNLDTAAARREALRERAHVARRNYVDPRAVDRHTVWNYGNSPQAIPTSEGTSDN